MAYRSPFAPWADPMSGPIPMDVEMGNGRLPPTLGPLVFPSYSPAGVRIDARIPDGKNNGTSIPHVSRSVRELRLTMEDVVDSLYDTQYAPREYGVTTGGGAYLRYDRDSFVVSRADVCVLQLGGVCVHYKVYLYAEYQYSFVARAGGAPPVTSNSGPVRSCWEIESVSDNAPVRHELRRIVPREAAQYGGPILRLVDVSDRNYDSVRVVSSEMTVKNLKALSSGSYRYKRVDHEPTLPLVWRTDSQCAFDDYFADAAAQVVPAYEPPSLSEAGGSLEMYDAFFADSTPWVDLPSFKVGSLQSLRNDFLMIQEFQDTDRDFVYVERVPVTDGGSLLPGPYYVNDADPDDVRGYAVVSNRANADEISEFTFPKECLRGCFRISNVQEQVPDPTPGAAGLASEYVVFLVLTSRTNYECHSTEFTDGVPRSMVPAGYDCVNPGDLRVTERQLRARLMRQPGMSDPYAGDRADMERAVTAAMSGDGGVVPSQVRPLGLPPIPPPDSGGDDMDTPDGVGVVDAAPQDAGEPSFLRQDLLPMSTDIRRDVFFPPSPNLMSGGGSYRRVGMEGRPVEDLASVTDEVLVRMARSGDHVGFSGVDILMEARRRGLLGGALPGYRPPLMLPPPYEDEDFLSGAYTTELARVPRGVRGEMLGRFRGTPYVDFRDARAREIERSRWRDDRLASFRGFRYNALDPLSEEIDPPPLESDEVDFGGVGVSPESDAALAFERYEGIPGLYGQVGERVLDMGASVARRDLDDPGRIINGPIESIPVSTDVGTLALMPNTGLQDAYTQRIYDVVEADRGMPLESAIGSSQRGISRWNAARGSGVRDTALVPLSGSKRPRLDEEDWFGPRRVRGRYRYQPSFYEQAGRRRGRPEYWTVDDEDFLYGRRVRPRNYGYLGIGPRFPDGEYVPSDDDDDLL